jgi:hypothetical protein
MARKDLQFQVVFEPTRLGEQPLRVAYDYVIPIKRRTLHKAELLDSPSESVPLERKNS